jgi:cysteine desulfurase
VIYLDYNATTPVHPQVFDAMEPYLKGRWGNPSSPYRPGREAKAAIEQARRRIADCIGCKPTEIVFTAGGTESDNLALRGAIHALKGSGNHIITSSVEHHAVLNTCRTLEREGYRVTYLPVNPDGKVDPDDVARSLSPETILISIMLANNETGVVNPIADIAEIAKHRTVFFHTDAVQGLGKIAVRVNDLGADFVAFSGHKIYGPKGSGFLYVKEGTPLLPVTTGGSHEHGLRAGTENVPGIVGLAEAVALACDKMAVEGPRLEALRYRLESEVCGRLDGVRVNGCSVRRVPNTSNLSFQSVDGESIVLALDLEGICVSTGSACATGDPEPSHVLTAMGLSAREAQGSIRVSLGEYTTKEDIDFTVQTLVHAVERLRAISSVVLASTADAVSSVN